VAVAVLEFVIATTGVQILHLPHSTDFATYYLAGVLARERLSPYDTPTLAARGRALGFQHEQSPFLYPPPFAIAMQPLARLPYPRARQIWMLLATGALLAAVAWTALLMRRLVERHGIENRNVYWTVLAAFVPAALNSTGVHNDIRAGSVGILLYLALVAAAWSMLAGRRLQTGAALALATLLKLTPAAAIPWAAWRGARWAAGLALLALALAMLPALRCWGWGILPDYVHRALLPAWKGEFPFPMNQSLDGMLSRLLVPSTFVHSPFDRPELKQALAAVLSLAVLVATLASLRRRARHATLLPVELGHLTLALLILMKITWLHTLSALLFVWPCLMLAILRAAERGARWSRAAGLWACAGFFLSSAHLPVLWEGLRRGPWALATSVHLVGLVILWTVSRTVLRHESDCV
jgi:hypothetical protein